MLSQCCLTAQLLWFSSRDCEHKKSSSFETVTESQADFVEFFLLTAKENNKSVECSSVKNLLIEHSMTHYEHVFKDLDFDDVASTLQSLGEADMKSFLCGMLRLIHSRIMFERQVLFSQQSFRNGKISRTFYENALRDCLEGYEDNVEHYVFENLLEAKWKDC